MKKFMDEDFLLEGEIAKTLYHNYASDISIIDYHCHLSPREIYEDKHFDNITEAWLSGDHYKWRLMRSDGIDEHYITGDAPDDEKFRMFAACLSRAIGNPMYHWCHLELKKYFGYDGILNEKTADYVWHLTEEKLQNSDMGARGLIEKSNVAFIGTTDDPADTLIYHEKISKDKCFNTVVAPSFRPDKALNIDKSGWCEYIFKLSEASKTDIKDANTLKDVLVSRMNYFALHGCRASDHGLDYIFYRRASDKEIDEIFKKGIAGNTVTKEEAEKFKTELLLFCAREYAKLGWVMQLHFNCLRNANTLMYKKLGADTGYDCIGPHNGSAQLASLLDELNSENSLPRTVLYSLDGNDNAFLDALTGSFQNSECAGKLQHGSAWWFNDTKRGMKEQMTSLASLGILGNFIGMTTDSRSFLSYTRHEYFRRILCDLLGKWVENGEYPADMDTLGRIVKDICFVNASRYFGLEETIK